MANSMTTNYYVWAFGKVKFSRTIGGSEVEAIFDSRSKMKLIPRGVINEDIDYNRYQRIKAFQGSVINRIDNYNATQSDALILLLNMISDLIHTSGVDNKTITMVPGYSTDTDAINEEYEVSIPLGVPIGAIDELIKNVESVQYWDFSWIILDAITTLPTNVTIYSGTTLTGDDDEDLIGDDDETLTEG